MSAVYVIHDHQSPVNIIPERPALLRQFGMTIETFSTKGQAHELAAALGWPVERYSVVPSGALPKGLQRLARVTHRLEKARRQAN